MPRWYLWHSWAKQKYSCFLRIDLIYSWRRLEGRISSRMWLSTTRRIATAVVGVDFAAFIGSVRYCSKVVNKSENEATTTVTPFSSFFTLSLDREHWTLLLWTSIDFEDPRISDWTRARTGSEYSGFRLNQVLDFGLGISKIWLWACQAFEICDQALWYLRALKQIGPRLT